METGLKQKSDPSRKRTGKLFYGGMGLCGIFPESFRGSKQDCECLVRIGVRDLAQIGYCGVVKRVTGNKVSPTVRNDNEISLAQ